MGVLDWILLAALALSLALVVRSVRKKRRTGGSCCGDCTTCPGSANCREKTQGR